MTALLKLLMHSFIGSLVEMVISALNLFSKVMLSIVIKLVGCVSGIMNIITIDMVVRLLRVEPAPKIGITGKLNRSVLMILIFHGTAL